MSTGIAIICPIGTLAENGYQHIAEPCIKSMAEFADIVYLVQSHNDTRNLDWLPDNVVLISNRDTWFRDGYDSAQMNHNLNIGFDQAKIGDYKIGILMSSNSYIPRHHQEALKRSLADIGAWDYYYRGNLIGGQLFRPSKRLPYIVNMKNYPVTLASFAPDGLFHHDKFISPEYGDYSYRENASIVDVPLEMTLPEFEAKMNWVRCYSDLMPKRNPEMHWEYWRDYHIAKIKQMTPSSDLIDYYWQAIIASIRPDFISHEVLRG